MQKYMCHYASVEGLIYASLNNVYVLLFWQNVCVYFSKFVTTFYINCTILLLIFTFDCLHYDKRTTWDARHRFL